MLMFPKTQEEETTITKYKIIIVNDRPIIRDGLALVINRESDLTVCGNTDDLHTSLLLIEQLSPNLVITDVTIKGGCRLELVRILRDRYPKLPVLIISMTDNSLCAEHAMRAGAKGFVSMKESSERIVEAIRRIIAGDIYISSNIAMTMLRKFVGGGSPDERSPVERLSDRELEIFHLIGQGLGTRAIAEELHLSVKTIESYRALIKEKLGLKNASALIQYAVRWVLSQQSDQSFD